MPTYLDKGGILPEDVVGMGVRTKQKYVMHENETVVPSGKGGETNIQLIVNNNTGTPVKARQEEPKFDGQKMIVTLWLDAWDRNKMGLRDRLGGV